MSAFDEATALTQASGVWTARTDPRFWMQVGPFGGWSAAVALRAMAEAAQFDGVPVALAVNFLGAIAQGTLALRPTVMKQNKSSAFWSVDARAAEEGDGTPPALSATALFARRRDTAGYQEVAMPEVPPPSAVSDLDTRGYGPVWVHSYELRHAVGMPLSRGKDTRSIVWTKLRDGRPLDFIRLAAYCDASIARPFYRIPTIAPVATVSMNAYFHCEPPDLERAGNGYLLIDSTARIGRRGYTDQTSTLWSEDGRLLATAEQLMWFNIPADLAS
jgi:acyl-CoA thioesterase